jgi:hypothetical protein
MLGTQLCHSLWHNCVGWRRPRLCDRKCSRLLHNWGGVVLTVETDHVLEVPLREAFHLRQLVVKVARQTRNHSAAPALASLPFGDGSADVPIEADQFCIGGEHRSTPRSGPARKAIRVWRIPDQVPEAYISPTLRRGAHVNSPGGYEKRRGPSLGTPPDHSFAPYCRSSSLIFLSLATARGVFFWLPYVLRVLGSAP